MKKKRFQTIDENFCDIDIVNKIVNFVSAQNVNNICFLGFSKSWTDRFEKKLPWSFCSFSKDQIPNGDFDFFCMMDIFSEIDGQLVEFVKGVKFLVLYTSYDNKSFYREIEKFFITVEIDDRPGKHLIAMKRKNE